MAWLDELKKITRPYDEDEEYIENDEVDEAPEDDEPEQSPEYEERRAPSRAVFSKKEPKYAPAPAPEKSKMKLVLSSPESFDEAAEIADNLLDKRAVLMNLESTNKDVARRLIDFLSGVAYALGGKIKRVSAQAYILTPCNVDLVGDAVEEFESSGIYF